MDNQELKERYFNTLKSAVGSGMYYDHLLRGLYNREFYSPLELDSNRASYGLWFRRRYMSDSDAGDLGPCSVLEMMIALAEQIDIHIDMTSEERIQRYFWMMIENLGMLGLTDMAWGPNMDSDFNNKIDILLDRKYENDGIGSLFPLQNYPINPTLIKFRERTSMRDRDIWSQRCLFDITGWERWKGLI